MTESVLARPVGLRADAARNRDRLLDSARTCLAAGQPMQLNAIAHAAGVGVGTAYRHFPTTQTLLEAMAMNALEALAGRVHEAIRIDDPAEALRAVLLEAWTAMRDDEALAELLASGRMTCADAASVAGTLLTAFGALLVRARAAGVVRADIGPDDIRRLLVGMQAAAVAGGPVPDPDRYVQILLAGLRQT